jgi:hypothetical protein
MKLPFLRFRQSQSIEPDSEAAKRNAAAMVDMAEEQLKPAGFVHRKHTTLWRRTNRKFDILQFDVIPRARRLKWGVPAGSFRLEVSCLFPFLPREGYAPDDDRPLRPEEGYGQVRLWIRRGMSQRAVKAKNIWWVGEDRRVFEAVTQDVFSAIHDKALPFFSRFEDAEELLRTFLDDEMSMEDGGIWEFGNKGSPRRLLYTGFAALECGQWDLAISSLQACQEKVMALKWPAADNPIRAIYFPYVDVGPALAEQRRRWSLS